jgi:uncharacterized membrane-anchored protein
VHGEIKPEAVVIPRHGGGPADSSGLGYEGGALVFAAMLALIAAAYLFAEISHTGWRSS